jgi:hypothetical protein
MGNLKIPPERTNCVSRVAHKKIPFSGKQTSRLYLLNPSERSVDKVQVDGCAITEAGRLRCDWAVEVDDEVSHEEIFIELKGSHVSDAVRQLESTIDALSSDPAQRKKRCLVAYSRCPLTRREIRLLKRKFQRQYNARFEQLRNGSSHPL